MAAMLGITLSAMVVATAPVLSLAFMFFEQLNMEEWDTTPASLPVLLAVYWSLIGGAFRLGLNSK